MSENPPSEITYSDDYHSKLVLQNLREFRGSNEFCDIVIKVANAKYSCHKCILAGSIPYFQTMFRGNFIESNQKYVIVNGLSPGMMDLFVDYAYTSSIVLNVSNASEIIFAADYLGLLNVRDEAIKFLIKNVNEENWLEIYKMPEYGNSKLKTKAFEFALKNFEIVSQRDDFKFVTPELLTDLLHSFSLFVSNEESAFSAIVQWFNAQADKTNIDFVKIMGHVRLCLLDARFLHNCIERFPILQQYPEVLKLIDNAKYYLLFPHTNLKEFEFLSEPRFNSNIVKICAIVKHETNNKPISLEMFPKKKYNTIFVVKKFLIPSVFKTAKVIPGDCMPYVYGVVNDKTKILKIDVITRKLETLESMTCPIRNNEIVPVDNYFYSVGGFCGNVPSENIKRFEDMQWRNVAKLNTIVTNPVVVTHNAVIYVIGGADVNGKTSRIVQAYDCASRSVSLLPSMRIDGAKSAGYVFKDYIFVFGAVSRTFDASRQLQTVPLDSVERYDISNKSWKILSPLPRTQADAESKDPIFEFGDDKGEFVKCAETFGLPVLIDDPVTKEWNDFYRGCRSFMTFNLQKSSWEALF